MQDYLSNESLALLGEYAHDFDREVGYTKPQQFGDIDATVELDIFQDEYSELFV